MKNKANGITKARRNLERMTRRRAFFFYDLSFYAGEVKATRCFQLVVWPCIATISS
ncbi:MAG: hypothetical protein ACYSOC_06485 [Planctomycetota bacterium]|jgi:hypothetical protein